MFKQVGKTKIRTSGVWLLLALLLSACQPIMPVPAQPPAGLRPDAPTYAVHGPFAVGDTHFVIGDGDDAIQMTVWYPAQNSAQAKEKITYHLSEKVTSIPPLSWQSVFPLAWRFKMPRPIGPKRPIHWSFFR